MVFRASSIVYRNDSRKGAKEQSRKGYCWQMVIRRKKIIIVLLGLVLASQLPFAYRRYRLGRLNSAIQQLASQRVPPPIESGFVDYQGVIHVHTFLGGHSTGTFTELIEAAKANQLDFVIMTEHPQKDFDTAATTLNGVHGGVLFVNGNEVSTANGDRLLLIPGSDTENSAITKSTQQVIDEQKARRGLTIVAYPNEFRSLHVNGFDGIEVYNLFTNTQRMNRAVTAFDALWSYRAYPDLVFANFFQRPTEELQRWDEIIASGNRKVVATAGNDAHSNVGLSINDSAGHQLLGIKLDPYARSFHTVRTHVLVEKNRPLTRESLLEAITHGHCYISFDIFGAAAGFNLTVLKGAQQTMMGEEVGMSNGLHLRATAPLVCRFVLFRNGNVVGQKTGASSAEFEVHEKGAYRVEAYLDSLPSPAVGKPWIISNPIYIR
jgi:hypothetical protein